MFELKGRLLEVTGGVFEGNNWVQCQIRSKEIADGKILKYKVNAKNISKEELDKFLDKDISVECDVVRGSDSTAALRIQKFVK